MTTDAFKTALFDSFYSIQTSMDRILEPVVRENGLTPLHAMILFAIQKMELKSLGALCRATGLGQPNASMLCKKLEREGLLLRRRSKEDERMVSLALTEKGDAALLGVARGMERYDSVLETVPKAQLEEIIRGLTSAQDLFKCLANSAEQAAGKNQ